MIVVLAQVYVHVWVESCQHNRRPPVAPCIAHFRANTSAVLTSALHAQKVMKMQHSQTRRRTPASLWRMHSGRRVRAAQTCGGGRRAP
jgi:hypothetical protein